MNSNPFTSRYKDYSAVQLLEILANKDAYQPLAVETAQAELDSRKLTAEQLQEIKQTLAAQQQKKTFDIGKKAMQIGTTVLDDVNITKPKPPERILRIICVIIGLVTLYNLSTRLGFLQFMFTSEDARWDLGTLSIFLPYIYLPVTIAFIFIRWKAGWIMLCAWLSYTIVSAVSSAIMELKLRHEEESIFDRFMPSNSIGNYLIMVVIFIGLLYFISTKPIKDIFSIGRTTQILSICLAAVATAAFWYFTFS